MFIAISQNTSQRGYAGSYIPATRATLSRKKVYQRVQLVPSVSLSSKSFDVAASVLRDIADNREA